MSDHMIGNGSAAGNGHGSTGSRLTTTPFPASRKAYVQGTQAGVRVPMREISLTATKSMNGGTPAANEPITVYDTSGYDISGFSQQQSGGSSLSFSSQHGLVDVAQLPAHLFREMQRFFEDYKVLEHKQVVIEDILGPSDALGYIREPIDLYQQLRRGELKSR